MKILVTGGAGYIGDSLVDALESIEKVEQITVFDNLLRENTHFFTEGKKLKKTTFVKGDILNIYDLEKVIKGQDMVVHLAAHVEFPYSYQDNYKYEQVNHYGTVVLYNLLERFPVDKVINLSSAAVYGFGDHVTEKNEPAPANFYGASKWNGEKYLDLLRPKTKVYQIRSANVFGYNPMVRLDSVINRFMFDALVYGKIKIHGTGNQLRPFISMDKLVDYITSLVQSDTQDGVYNLVEMNISMNEIRDFLMEKIPDLEFAYLNSNQEFKKLSMTSDKLNFMANPDILLENAFQEFQSKIRF